MATIHRLKISSPSPSSFIDGPDFFSLRPASNQPAIERFPSDIGIDAVLGPGGWVRGAVYLLSGGPGSGKSTLLLRASAAATAHGPVAYLTGEESVVQVQDRAKRLGLSDSPVRLAETTTYKAALTALLPTLRRGLLVIDSIQRMHDPGAKGEIGSVLQVRRAAHAFITFARETLSTIVLICHETKGGRGAGPNALFHDVDVVLRLQRGDDGQTSLFAEKNRFGPTQR